MTDRDALAHAYEVLAAELAAEFAAARAIPVEMLAPDSPEAVRCRAILRPASFEAVPHFDPSAVDFAAALSLDGVEWP